MLLLSIFKQDTQETEYHIINTALPIFMQDRVSTQNTKYLFFFMGLFFTVLIPEVQIQLRTL